jgi:hypothetical protein
MMLAHCSGCTIQTDIFVITLKKLPEEWHKEGGIK